MGADTGIVEVTDLVVEVTDVVGGSVALNGRRIQYFCDD